MAASSSDEHAGDELRDRATPLSGTQLIPAHSTRHLYPVDPTYLPARRDISARSTGHFWPLGGGGQEGPRGMRAESTPRAAHTARVRSTDQRSRKISTAATQAMTSGTGRSEPGSGSVSRTGPQLQA